jgi:hypothetical protein
MEKKVRGRPEMGNLVLLCERERERRERDKRWRRKENDKNIIIIIFN